MKLSIISVLSILTIGASAFAIPAFDGTYSCTAVGASGVVTSVTFTTRDNRLFLSGFEGASQEGIPCANGTQSDAGNGASIIVVSVCTDNTLSVKVQASQSSTDTNVSVLTKFVLTDSQTVNMTVATSGKVNGKDTSATLDLVCKK